MLPPSCVLTTALLSDKSPSAASHPTSGVIAHDQPGPVPVVAQDRAQRERVGAGWHASYLVERAHQRVGASVEGRPERRQKYVAQRGLRDVDGVVIAPAFGGAVGHEVLGTSRHLSAAAEPTGLEATARTAALDRSEEHTSE